MSKKFRTFMQGKYSISSAVPWLLLSVFVLLVLSRVLYIAGGELIERQDKYLTSALFQILIFPIPMYIFWRATKDRPASPLRSRLSPRSFKLSHLFLILSAALVLICGATLLSMVCGMLKSQVSFTLYGTFRSQFDGTAWAAIRLIISYGILPAAFEEIMFRGIVAVEYERHGILFSSLVSAVFFAMLHFDIFAFPVYLFAGLLLAVVMYVTRSTVASMAVHFLYNLFGIFVQAGLSGYSQSTGSIGLLVIILVAFFLLGLAFLCGEISRILRGRANPDLMTDATEIATPGVTNLKANQWGSALLSVAASPPAVAAVALWIGMTVVNVFI